jgi:hypothetical protein
MNFKFFYDTVIRIKFTTISTIQNTSQMLIIPFLSIHYIRTEEDTQPLTAEHIRMHCLGLVHFCSSESHDQKPTCKGSRIIFLLVRMEMYNFVVTEEYRSFSSSANFNSTATLGRQPYKWSDPAGHIRHEHLLSNLRRPTFGSGVRFGYPSLSTCLRFSWHQKRKDFVTGENTAGSQSDDSTPTNSEHGTGSSANHSFRMTCSLHLQGIS